MTHADKEALLIRLDERVEHLVGWAKTHKELHTRLAIAFIAAAVSAFLALGTTIISLVVMLARQRPL